MTWIGWRRYFEHQQRRPLPAIAEPAGLTPARRQALIWSLARFQLGETGEGRIARDIWRVRLSSIDDDYRIALGLFVKEEGRHARVLAQVVRVLGGELLARSWSERAFRLARRALGTRTKLLALLAAEAVGIGFYSLFAAALPAGAMRAALEEIACDERAHLRFHADFFAAEAPRGWRALVFRAAWAGIGAAAVLMALGDHRRTLRTLGIPLRHAVQVFAALIRDGGGQRQLGPRSLRSPPPVCGGRFSERAGLASAAPGDSRTPLTLTLSPADGGEGMRRDGGEGMRRDGGPGRLAALEVAS